MPVRGLDQVLADLDARARQGPPSKNRPLTKFAALADSFAFSSDTQTTANTTAPYQYAPASTGTKATVGLAGNFQ